MRQGVFVFLFFIFFSTIHAQADEDVRGKLIIDSINRLVDRAVVQKKLPVLQKLYADDFVFTHGTGLVDSKSTWLKNVADTSVHFVYREHDSTLVEMHKDVAIITGKLTVRRQMPDGINAYALRYVRVYANRQDQWQMISHRTTSEWHLKE